VGINDTQVLYSKSGNFRKFSFFTTPVHANYFSLSGTTKFNFVDLQYSDVLLVNVVCL